MFWIRIAGLPVLVIVDLGQLAYVHLRQQRAIRRTEFSQLAHELLKKGGILEPVPTRTVRKRISTKRAAKVQQLVERNGKVVGPLHEAWCGREGELNSTETRRVVRMFNF
jgi:hypothetical protein